MPNPNPSPETRFGGPRGNPQNPGGKTPEQHALDMSAAQKAAELREKVLSTALGKIESGTDPLDVLDSNLRNVMKDSEDRAHGTPKQTSEFSGPNGGPVEVTEMPAEERARRIASLLYGQMLKEKDS